MLSPLIQHSDDALFVEVSRRRKGGEDFREHLGELVERWRSPAFTVVRRVQGSFRKGSPDDQGEIFQEAVGKLIARGLIQFRGASEQIPGKAASPKTFFLRIVKHVAIDRYRRQREDLAVASEGTDLLPNEGARALEASRRKQQASDASCEYWAAYQRLQAEHPNEAAAWELYHHRDVEDHDECARLLQISVANSYKRVSRAQAYLKLYLLELRGEEESR